jgi:hypothetical protein
MQKFRFTLMKENEGLYDHLTLLSTMADELSEVSARPIDDDDFMTTLCFSIMHIERFKNVVEIIMNNETALTRNALVNKLMAAEQRQPAIAGRETNEPQTALKAETDRKKKGQRKHWSSEATCYNCGRKGHLSRNCRLKKKDAQSANKA